MYSWYFSLRRHRNLLHTFYFSQFILLAPKITQISSAALTVNAYPIAPIYFWNINNQRLTLTSAYQKKKYHRWDRREFWNSYFLNIQRNLIYVSWHPSSTKLRLTASKVYGPLIILYDPLVFFFIERNIIYVFVSYCIY